MPELSQVPDNDCWEFVGMTVKNNFTCGAQSGCVLNGRQPLFCVEFADDILATDPVFAEFPQISP